MLRTSFETPFGTMHLAVNDRGEVTEIDLPGRAGSKRLQTANAPREAHAGLRAALAQLDEYFHGKRRVFDLPLVPAGTPFEQLVWKRLRDIPFGATVSYGQIASELHLSNGARAVGRANGANPIPIVIPCHRVIGADGNLVGFGGGIALKRALLEMEGAIAPPEPRLF